MEQSKEYFMKQALKEAEKAYRKLEVPVGAVVVKEGKIMFEIAGVSEEVAREALRLAAHKLPIKTKFVKRENGGEINEG